MKGETIMEQRSKTNDVLTHLKEKGSITSMEAINLYGATRLSAIIFNLRKLGLNIESINECGTDRYGRTCNYARYFLREEQ